MHRTQISLQSEQYERLTEEARQLGISMSALIRQLIDEHIARHPQQEDPLKDLIGIAEGSGEDISGQHNDYLYGKGRE